MTAQQWDEGLEKRHISDDTLPILEAICEQALTVTRGKHTNIAGREKLHTGYMGVVDRELDLDADGRDHVEGHLRYLLNLHD